MVKLPFIRNFHPGYVLEWPEDLSATLVSVINDAYVRLFEDNIWYDTIVMAHTRLTAIDPDYRIVQIKEKFGGLRYYFHTETSHETWRQMQDVVNDAETIASTITYKAATHD